MIKTHLRRGAAVALVVSSSACVTLPAPTVSSRPAVAIAAPLEETWTAALDQLADHGIAVRTVDRDAGFIATESMALPLFSTSPTKWADCGTFAGFRYAPTVVDYTLFVRGNSTESSLKTSARYRVQNGTGELPADCVSTGAFEQSFDVLTKQRAETAQRTARQP